MKFTFASLIALAFALGVSAVAIPDVVADPVVTRIEITMPGGAVITRTVTLPPVVTRAPVPDDPAITRDLPPMTVPV
ncbi:hypothetical protein B0H34DRAFT_707047 [Crassisporium funariophilum]|nr:hypothetical protein B0H34DRAFT_707047 [Crassisporium funariophilum]